MIPKEKSGWSAVDWGETPDYVRSMSFALLSQKQTGGKMKKQILFCGLLLIVVGSVCLCSKKEQTNISASDFRITNLVFCSTEPENYMVYQEQLNATYKPGDVVWIYMNLSNVKYKQNPDSSYEIFIPEHLQVKSPKGEVLLDTDLLTEPITFGKERDMNQVFLTNNINTIETLEDGEYEVNIAITDKLSGRSTSATAKFKLKK